MSEEHTAPGTTPDTAPDTAPDNAPDNAPGPRRRTLALVAALALLVGAGAATGVAAAAWPGEARAPVPYVYEGDALVDSAPGHSAFLEARVTAYHCGMSFITGTHAEHPAKGQICRVGVRLDNQQPVTANIDSRLQTIVLDDGREVPIDDESMQIKRQQQVQQMGARNIIVLSYWFDIPADRAPVAVRIRAAADAPPAEIALPAHTWRKQ